MGTGAINYNLTMVFAKLALFLLYHRLFASHRWTKIAICLGSIMSCLIYGAFSIAYCVLCIPGPGESWISTNCVQKTTKQNYFQGAFNLASDLYIFVLPLPVLSSLQMPLRRKLGVTATFGTGFM